MTDTFITQCPHCHTSFRLERSQLTAARGSVRCGACLQVFNAASQIDQFSAQPSPILAANDELEPDDSAVEQPSTATDTARSTDLNNLLIHDDMDLDDLDMDGLDELDLDAELARLEHEEQLGHSSAPALDLHADSALAEEDWSDEVLAETPVPPLASQPPKEADSESEAGLELELESQETEPEQLAQPAAVEPTASEPSSVQATQSSPAPLSAEVTPALSISAQRDYTNQPIRLDWRPKKKPWKRWLAWSLLNVLAVLLLVGQYTQHNFTQLARQDSTRPWLEALCPLIGCQLPTKVDVRHIKSSNLLVRSHPEFSGALLVDAIIYNRASFAQPFPLLELTFSDQHNQVVAKRLFTPLEYLAGELAGQKHMPPQTPIHIALEVLEPSGGVMSYQLSFISPD